MGPFVLTFTKYGAGNEGNEGDEGDEEEEGFHHREGQAGESSGASWVQGKDRQWSYSECSHEEQAWQSCFEGQPCDAQEDVPRQQGTGVGQSLLAGQEATQPQGLRSFRRQDSCWQGLVCQGQGHLQRLKHHACAPFVVPALQLWSVLVSRPLPQRTLLVL